MNKKRVICMLWVIILVVCARGDAQESNQTAKECYQRGNTYFQQGRYEEAQKEFDKALLLLKGRSASSEDKPAVKQVASAKEENVVATQSRVEEKPPARKLKKQSEYIINEEDELGISVWQNPDLDQTVTVRPDGRISCLLIGDVVAVGRTIMQLDQEITEGLKEYIKFPEVSVSLKKIGGRRVVVLGEVLGPGVYQMTGTWTVWEAIGMAGGFTNDAVPSSVILVRGGFENPKARRLSLNRALQGDPRYNIAIEPEDVIYVPKKFIADFNYILNEIMQPLQQGNYIDQQLHYWKRQRAP